MAACNQPVSLWRRRGATEGRPLTWKPREDAELYERLEVACGDCHACRANLRTWRTIQIAGEAQTSAQTLFLTLTYAPEHLPPGAKLRYSDFQSFMRRIRRFCKREAPGSRVRYAVFGEYGARPRDGLPERPHWHAFLFFNSFELSDLISVGKSRSGIPMFEHPVIDYAWGRGRVTIQRFHQALASYGAKGAQYSSKSLIGDLSPDDLVDVDTGEVFARLYERGRYSSRPGLGHRFFYRYAADMARDGYVLLGGVKYMLPPYWRELLKRTDPVAHERLWERLETFAQENTRTPAERRRNERFREVQVERAHLRKL